MERKVQLVIEDVLVHSMSDSIEAFNPVLHHGVLTFLFFPLSVFFRFEDERKKRSQPSLVQERGSASKGMAWYLRRCFLGKHSRLIALHFPSSFLTWRSCLSAFLPHSLLYTYIF